MPGIVKSEKHGAQLTGTDSQIQWALQIIPRVHAEFDRVSKAFAAVATDRNAAFRRDTEAIIAILEEKRTEVMTREHAGYFIREWQELTDQVRLLINSDARYQAIRLRWRESVSNASINVSSGEAAMPL